MKKWLLFIALAVPSACFAQGVRVDNIAIRGGNPLLSISNAVITVCTSAGTGLPCTPLATTYTDATLVTPCAAAKPVVLANTSTCVAGADNLGNYGFWVAPGKYVVTITAVGIPGYSTTLTLQCPLDGNCIFTGALTATMGVQASPLAQFSGPDNSGIRMTDTTNPGNPGAGLNLFFYQHDSAGSLVAHTDLQSGCPTVTAGAMQCQISFNSLVNGTVRTLAFGGIAGGGSTAYITPGDALGPWQLGIPGQGWSKIRMEQNNGPSIEFRDTGAALPNGLVRFVQSGGNLLFNRNTAVAGDFSTAVTDLRYNASGGNNGLFEFLNGLATSGVTNSTGIQLFNTTTTCTTGASIGAICTTAAITLPVAYADTNYRLSCTGQTSTNVPIVQTYTKSNTTFTITIAALTAAAATFTSYDCSAVHN